MKMIVEEREFLILRESAQGMEILDDWLERYDRVMAEFYELQEEILEAVKEDAFLC